MLRKRLARVAACFMTVCLFCMPVSFADSGGMGTEPGVTPLNPNPLIQTIMSLSASFVRLQDGSAHAYVYATSGSVAKITSSVELQSRDSPADEFETELGPVYKRVLNSTYIEQNVYFPVSMDKEYRIKVTVSDNVNGMESSVTDYFELQESD